MANKVIRVLQTELLKIKFGNKISITGFQNFHPNTKLIIRQNGKIYLGRSIATYSNVHLSAINGTLNIGNAVSFNRNDIVICRDSIIIGNGCLFGPNVCLYDHDHIFNTDGIKNDFKTSPIVIENNCWIGAGSIILRGTHIGEGSVIGAGTVVKGNIPPHSLVTSDRKMIIRPIEERG